MTDSDLLHHARRFLALFAGRDFSTCWVWPAAHNGKYGVMSRWKRARIYAHRFAYILYIGDIPPGRCIMHTCDTPLCVNPTHLLSGTIMQNNRDCKSKGRAAVGVRHGMAKLSAHQVRAIREDVRTYSLIAADYNVTRELIGLIKRNKLWKHLLEEREELS